MQVHRSTAAAVVLAATIIGVLLAFPMKRRFINEDTYAGFLGNAINEQPESTAWLIVDSAESTR